MDQVKFAEDSCLPQVLLAPFLNALSSYVLPSHCIDYIRQLNNYITGGLRKVKQRLKHNCFQVIIMIKIIEIIW